MWARPQGFLIFVLGCGPLAQAVTFRRHEGPVKRSPLDEIPGPAGDGSNANVGEVGGLTVTETVREAITAGGGVGALGAIGASQVTSTYTVTITETAAAVDGETGDALAPKITTTLYHLAPALTVTEVSTTTLMQMIPCGTTDGALVPPGQDSPTASSANDVSSPELVTVTSTLPVAVVPPTYPVEPPPVTTSASEPVAPPATSSVDIPNFSFSNIISAPPIETPAVPSETTAEEAPAPIESSTAAEPAPPSETSAPAEATPPSAETTQAPEETQVSDAPETVVESETTAVPAETSEAPEATGAPSSTAAEASSSASLPATSEITTVDPTGASPSTTAEVSSSSSLRGTSETTAVDSTGASSSTATEALSSSIPATSETTAADPTSTAEPEPVDEETEALAPTPTSVTPQSSLELPAGPATSVALPVQEDQSPTTRIGQAPAASGAYTGVREGPSVVLSGHTLVNTLYLGNLVGPTAAAAAATGGPMTLGALRSAATTAGGPLTLGVLAG